ncbi:RNA polymerase ECF-type sigma factor [hydrothermal vent metagenome]|uniref:RNA polymerase ECF-type sigma factor n=1 Tax=hydrothermal vent metagenome TaxID=652676 RepID=A0A3B0YBA0_9ZZZZ
MSRSDQQILQHIPRLRRYARALLGDVERAEDLVQETLLRALGKLHFWRRGSDMRAWLFTIMHNQFANECRRARIRPDVAVPGLAGTEPTGTDNAELRVSLRDIERALMLLPEEQRAVILLVSLEGLSYVEAARVLDIREGTLMSRLHRARGRLRGWLNETPGTVKPLRSVK